MENTFVIAWRSKSEPRWGQGKKLFSREDAEALAQELNEEYPAFLHQPLNIAEEGTVRAAIEECRSSVIKVDFEAAALVNLRKNPPNAMEVNASMDAEAPICAEPEAVLA